MNIQPVTAAPIEAGGAGPAAAVQRMQRLQALIAQVEEGPAGFAAALNAAQGDASQSLATAVAPVPGVSGSSVGATLPPQSQAPASGATGDGSYEALIAQAAAHNGVDPAILHGLIEQESGFDPNATSGAGALGLTQLMPGTAASLGVTDPRDPAQSIEGGARYLGEMLREFGGNTEDALAAYNAGPGAVKRYGGVPPYSETRQYVTKVLGYAAECRAQTQRSAIPATSLQGASATVIA